MRLLFLFAMTPLLSPAQNASAVGGKVLDDEGRGIGAAIIRALPIGSATRVADTTATADGSYSFSGIGAGRYGLCVSPRVANLVDECVWGTPNFGPLSASPATFEWSPSARTLSDEVVVGPGNNSAVVKNLAVRRGVLLRIRISDTNGLIASGEAGLAVTVFPPNGMGITMTRQLVRAGTYEFEATVPMNQPFTVAVQGSDGNLVDGRTVVAVRRGWSQLLTMGPPDRNGRTILLEIRR